VGHGVNVACSHAKNNNEVGDVMTLVTAFVMNHSDDSNSNRVKPKVCCSPSTLKPWIATTVHQRGYDHLVMMED